MKSMTGFSQGRFENDNFSINIIFKSLNHRFLDIGFKGTGINPTTEKLIKEVLKNRIYRGKIEIVFDLFDSNHRKTKIHFNHQLLGDILDQLIPFKKKYKKHVNLSMDSLLKIPMIFHLDYLTENYSPEELEKIRELVESVFNDFLKSRELEGKSIAANILKDLDEIQHYLALVEKETEKIEKELFIKYREKLARYLKEFEHDIEERRIIQEAALLAEKSCINEEINRLITHTKRFKLLVNDENLEVKGREADFLAQEMQRETHTIASKTNSMDVHEHILQIRRAIEKIKQQVQNVE